jgi:HEAT repeat protein
MDGGQGSSRHNHDPEGLLRSALEKIVFFECRVAQLESELAAAKSAAERARGEAAGVRRREVELVQALAGEKGARAEAERRATEGEDRVRLLEAERERLLGGLVERARLEGAPGSSGAPAPDEGQADLAGFIAELRAEIESLRAFRAAAVAAGYGEGASISERKAPEPAVSVAELGGRFDAAGRVGVSEGDRAHLAELLATRADRALYERSMGDLSAADAGKRLRAVRALEALGSRAAAPLLAAALGREAEAEVKGALLAALARFKEPFAAELADRELADPRPAVRVAALEALATVGDGRAPERLAAALADASPVVRRRAALLLGFTAGERAVEALAVALCDQDRGVARAAAAALSGRPSARAQAALARGLEHPDLSVRRAAATALGRLAGEEVDADGTASARRASSRRIAERLASMDAEELRAAVLRSAETARATAERVMAATARGAGKVENRVPVGTSSTSTSTTTSTTTTTTTKAAAPAIRTAVAVVDAPAPAPGAQDLEPRVVAELRAALRGATEAHLSSILGAPAARVEAALAALGARGAVERRGTRWFVC